MKKPNFGGLYMKSDLEQVLADVHQSVNLLFTEFWVGPHRTKH